MDDRKNFNQKVFIFKDTYLKMKKLINEYPTNFGADIPGDKYLL